MKPDPLSNQSADLGRVAQEMYKKNLELAETNKTLMLLRGIDEVVLSSVTDMTEVITRIATTVAEQSGFPFVIFYLSNKRTNRMVPKAVVARIGDPVAQETVARVLLEKSISARHTTNPTVRALKQAMIVTSSQLFEIVQPELPFDEAEELQEKLSLKTFFVCPLQARGEMIGAMVVGSSETPDELAFYQRSLLERLTVTVGIALDNTLLYASTKENARRLRTANRHLKELDETKDEFISMASHQLRTPLTSIKGYVSMLAEGDAGPVNLQQREFLDFAYGSSQRMVNLITDLLNVSRMSAGKFQIEPSEADLSAITADEVEQLQQHAVSKKLKLTFRPPKTPLPSIQLDEGKTRQVIMNFIDNAIYYTSKGEIVVSLERQRDSARLTVTDNGIGVPVSAQKKLFSKFYRADNAQTMRPDGTGLGLFMAKRVIEDQDGTIVFTSTEGKGSTFGFTLPLTKEPHGTHQRPTRK